MSKHFIALDRANPTLPSYLYELVMESISVSIEAIVQRDTDAGSLLACENNEHVTSVLGMIEHNDWTLCGRLPQNSERRGLQEVLKSRYPTNFIDDFFLLS